jgi:hypothetical protein
VKSGTDTEPKLSEQRHVTASASPARSARSRKSKQPSRQLSEVHVTTVSTVLKEMCFVRAFDLVQITPGNVAQGNSEGQGVKCTQPYDLSFTLWPPLLILMGMCAWSRCIDGTSTMFVSISSSSRLLKAELLNPKSINPHLFPYTRSNILNLQRPNVSHP